MKRKKAKQLCPCCGEATLDSRNDYEICGKCGWEDDPVQEKDPDFTGGSNELSLNQAKLAWKAKQLKKTNDPAK